MPRITIEERSGYPFECELEVRVADLNYGAHLGYDRLLSLAHQARLVLLEKWGLSEVDLGDGRTGVVAADLAVVYRGEAFVHDRLRFEIRVVEVRRGSFRLAHRVTRIADGRPVALIEIGFAAYDYRERRAARLPDGVREALAALDRDAP